ncbi:transposase [Laribacter hongkongensis]|uniref:integrase core domain-containing protein n=1 Tax=Laribacter hongkongensis TaxID=168471 RepID=UPI002831CFEB|nr:transposase [Laribacter hongkongensis]
MPVRFCSSLIGLGKSNQNACVESFNGHFRDECLNEHILSLHHARSSSRLMKRMQQ